MEKCLTEADLFKYLKALVSAPLEQQYKIF